MSFHKSVNGCKTIIIHYFQSKLDVLLSNIDADHYIFDFKNHFVYFFHIFDEITLNFYYSFKNSHFHSYH